MKNRLLETLRIACCICAAMGWWGVLYPELTLTQDTYRIIDETGRELTLETYEHWDAGKDVYLKILEAEPDQIRFRSKLVEAIAHLGE